MENNNTNICDLMFDKLIEQVNRTAYGTVNLEITMDKGMVAKVKITSEVKKMQFLDLIGYENNAQKSDSAGA